MENPSQAGAMKEGADLGVLAQLGGHAGALLNTLFA